MWAVTHIQVFSDNEEREGKTETCIITKRETDEYPHVKRCLAFSIMNLEAVDSQPVSGCESTCNFQILCAQMKEI